MRGGRCRLKRLERSARDALAAAACTAIHAGLPQRGLDFWQWRTLAPGRRRSTRSAAPEPVPTPPRPPHGLEPSPYETLATSGKPRVRGPPEVKKWGAKNLFSNFGRRPPRRTLSADRLRSCPVPRQQDQGRRRCQCRRASKTVGFRTCFVQPRAVCPALRGCFAAGRALDRR